MASGKLYTITLRLVRNRPANMTYADIAAATGLPWDWVRRFSEGKSDAASSRVEAVWEFMTSRELDVDGVISPAHYR
jgi:hypothetical protein